MVTRAARRTKDGEDDVPKDQEEVDREDADDAELDDEDTVKIFESRDEKAKKR